MGLVGGIGLTVFDRLERQCATVSSTVLPSLAALSEVKNAVAEVRFWSTRALVLAIDGKLDQLSGPWARREEARQRGEKSLEVLAATPLDPATRRLLDRFDPAFKRLLVDSQAAWDALKAGDAARANAIMAAYSPRVQSELAEPLQQCMDLQGKLGHDVELATANMATTARRRLWGALIASVVSGVILGMAIARSVTRSLAILAGEARRLRDAVAEGRLSERADPMLVAVEFRPILEGVNDTMIAFVKPIEVTTTYLTRISHGDIPAGIAEQYEGDFNLIKEALNRCIDAVTLLVSDAGVLAKAGVEGRLGTRADVARHQGDFRKVVQSVNDTLDAVLGPLRVVADYCERISHGDLPPRRTNEVHGDVVAMQVSLNRCVDAVTMLVADTRQLAQAAKDGKLSFRADASKEHSRKASTKSTTPLSRL
jgi:methyl-accepting chemotaxis protein